MKSKTVHFGLLLAALSLTSHGLFAEEEASAQLGKAADNKIYAQKLVNDLMAHHSDLLVVGIHATAPGSTQSKMIASNLDRIGKKDDDDDVAVATEHKTILAPNMKESNKFEVQVPLKDASGTTLIAAAGLVFKYKSGDDEIKLHQKALSIRDELAKKTPTLSALFEKTD